MCSSDLRQARPRKRQSAGFFEDLKPGNYVVHQQHGVGQYEGMVKRTIGGTERDYLLLSYKGGDKLYVPSDQIDTLRQYVGGEAPSLHRLGGADFAKAKSRVRSAVREIAQELQDMGVWEDSDDGFGALASGTPLNAQAPEPHHEWGSVLCGQRTTPPHGAGSSQPKLNE